MEKKDATQIYDDYLVESKAAGILPPSRVSEAMQDLAQVNGWLYKERTKKSIACQKQREKLLSQVDEGSAKPMTGTKADSIVASSEDGQRLAEIEDEIKAIDGYQRALWAHRQSMESEWGKEDRGV